MQKGEADSLTFIIPAYNDAATIKTVVEKTVTAGKNLRIPFTVLVINDASTDSTGKILTELKNRFKKLSVITHSGNAGYGGTIRELYKKARTAWLFSLPGDYQIEPDVVARLWPRRKGADMIIGWRFDRRDSAARKRQSGMYNFLLKLMFGLRLHDINSVRLMKTSVMERVHLTTSSAFVDAELVIRAIRAGYTVTELPIPHRARAGQGASGGRISTILPTVRDMVVFYLRL